MKETKKTLIVLVILFLLIMLLPLSLYIKQSNGQKMLNDIYDFYKNEEKSLIYIGSANCGYCSQFNPIVDSVAENYDFDYMYIDITKLTNKQFYELLDKFEIDESEFGTPYLVIGQKGQKKDEKAGYMAETQLVEYLKNSEFLAKDAEPKNGTEDKDTDALNFINVEEFKNLVNSDNKSVVVLGQTGCIYCTYAKPILNKIAKEKNITINYLEVDLIFNENDYKEFTEILGDLGIESFGTPRIMVVQNKKELDTIKGYTSEENYINLFKKYGFISE